MEELQLFATFDGKNKSELKRLFNCAFCQQHFTKYEGNYVLYSLVVLDFNDKKWVYR
jgi:hypothetical protein